MAKSVLTDARFHNEVAAFAYVEAELWPNGPVCPHCENNGGNAKIGRLQGKTTRPGWVRGVLQSISPPESGVDPIAVTGRS